jgi:hypothetical protein
MCLRAWALTTRRHVRHDEPAQCESRPPVHVQVEECYKQLVGKWSKVLGGFDIWGRSLCYKMYKHVQLELKL